MSTNGMAQVQTRDLALDYLDGLLAIALRLKSADGPGRAFAADLAVTLCKLDLGDPICFDPLRYEFDIPGMGWDAVASKIDELRQRLLQWYADAV